MHNYPVCILAVKILSATTAGPAFEQKAGEAGQLGNVCRGKNKYSILLYCIL